MYVKVQELLSYEGRSDCIREAYKAKTEARTYRTQQ
jgi:hypothetical protein